jgi:predicted phosphoadenosine phosphosulfate sulfurtransferase
VARVNGANSGARYARESGNILGNIKITKPEGHTWESFSMLLLESLPPKMQEHYKNKIAVFIKWWEDRGRQLEDDGPVQKGYPNWKRICKVLLRNDFWCRGLSFSMHKSGAYERYLERMKEKREEWGILP